jgi:hypothetical protein
VPPPASTSTRAPLVGLAAGAGGPWAHPLAACMATTVTARAELAEKL